MIRPLPGLRVCLAVALVAMSVGADRVLACAVCFGDPSSDMAKGAVAGVMALLGIVSFVLVGVAGTGIYFVRRGRRIQKENGTQPFDQPEGR